MNSGESFQMHVFSRKTFCFSYDIDAATKTNGQRQRRFEQGQSRY